jgi:hypothetical protein
MKYATVEDVISCFPQPVLPSVTGEPDYHTLHAIRKMLHANARSIDTHLGGGAFGHLGVIISDAVYEMSFLDGHPQSLREEVQQHKSVPQNIAGKRQQRTSKRTTQYKAHSKKIHHGN